jgi:hypothetical protein
MFMYDQVNHKINETFDSNMKSLYVKSFIHMPEMFMVIGL